jgi:hypothetical protein
VILTTKPQLETVYLLIKFEYLKNVPNIFNAYYAYGMEMPGRKWVYSDYRYSHNGQQDADEVFVGAQSAEYWMYDSRIGRRWEMDPQCKPWESPYATFANNPILYCDVLGLQPGEGEDKKSTASAPKQVGFPSNPSDGQIFDHTNTEQNANWRYVYDSETKNWVGVGMAKQLDNVDVVTPAVPKAVTTYGSGSSRERSIFHVAFTVSSYHIGGGASGVGGEGAIKEFHIDQNGMARSFLYPSDKPIYIWEADLKGGAHGYGAGVNFGDGFATGLNPWRPIDEQLNEMDDYDVSIQCGFVSVSTTREVSLNSSKIQYTMMGLEWGKPIGGLESPLSAGSGANWLANGSIKDTYKPTRRDSMRTAAAFPWTAEAIEFNKTLQK